MIADLDRLSLIVQRLHEDKHTVALITGCFDTLNLDYVNFLRFAKSNADVLIVGVDSDESIRISKGEKFVTNPLALRLQMLEAVRYVDFVFPIHEAFIFGSLEADTVHGSIAQKLQPQFLVTNPTNDPFYAHKLNRAQELQIKVIPYNVAPQPVAEVPMWTPFVQLAA